MLIIGTTQITRSRETGSFVCPGCGADAAYQRKSVQTFLTLYFIPVLPIGKRREYVECANCADAFRPDVTSLPREAIEEIRNAAAVRHVAHAMTMTLLLQPTISDAAINAFRAIYERLSGDVITPEQLRQHLDAARADQPDVDDVMQHIADHVDASWAARLVQAVFLMANADGDPTPEQMRLLTRLPQQLHMPESEFRELVAAASEAGEEVFR